MVRLDNIYDIGHRTIDCGFPLMKGTVQVAPPRDQLKT